MARPTVFLSYSKHDVDWRKRIQRFLRPLEVWGEVDVWADDRIGTGAEWFEEIRVAIGRAAVGICLVTTDFLGTEFIAKQEVPDLLRRREQRGMKLVPLLIHDCPWKLVRWLRQLQIIPPKGVPLDRLKPREQDAFLSRLAEEVGEFLESWDHDLPAPGFGGEEAPGGAELESEEAPRRSAPQRRGAPRRGARDPVRGPGPPRRGLSLGEDEPPLLERAAAFSLPSLAEEVLSAAVADLTRLPGTGAALFGRDDELDRLDQAWDSGESRVVAVVAAAGMGKTWLASRWVRDLLRDPERAPARAFAWSFDRPEARGSSAGGEAFLDAALRFFRDPQPGLGSPPQRGERLAGLLAAGRNLLILDDLDPLRGEEGGALRDPGIRALLERLARAASGLCLVTAREPLPDLVSLPGSSSLGLPPISPEAGRALLRHRGVVGTDAELEALAREFGPLALSLALLGSWLAGQPGRQASAAARLPEGGDPLDRLSAALASASGRSPA